MGLCRENNSPAELENQKCTVRKAPCIFLSLNNDYLNARFPRNVSRTTRRPLRLRSASEFTPTKIRHHHECHGLILIGGFTTMTGAGEDIRIPERTACPRTDVELLCFCIAVCSVFLA